MIIPSILELILLLILITIDKFISIIELSNNKPLSNVLNQLILKFFRHQFQWTRNNNVFLN